MENLNKEKLQQALCSGGQFTGTNCPDSRLTR